MQAEQNMQAEQKLREGDVNASLALLQEQVKAKPADAKLRIFLFQLLVIQGAWGRALNQLKVIGELDAGALAMVQTYREALRCEAYRGDVFAGKRSPHLFGKPEDWMALCVEALSHFAADRPDRGSGLTARAYEQAPETPGTLNGEPFTWIADADSRIGPFIEAIVNGTYYWVPFCRIREITIEEPEDLRDMVWAPAQFTWTNGGQMVGLIPTRYAGSENSEDSLVQLARKTEWIDQGSEQFYGLGQRVLATDAKDYALLETRKIIFDTRESDPVDFSEEG